MSSNAFTFGPVLDAAAADIKILLTQVASLTTRLAQLEAKMAEDFTELSAALDELKAEVADIGVRMDKLFADLTAALGSGNQAAVDAATAAIRVEIDNLKAAATRDTSGP